MPKLKKYTAVDVDKDGKVTILGSVFIDNDDIMAVGLIMDMHEVIINDVARLIMRSTQLHFQIKGSPTDVAEKINQEL